MKKIKLQSYQKIFLITFSLLSYSYDSGAKLFDILKDKGHSKNNKPAKEAFEERTQKGPGLQSATIRKALEYDNKSYAFGSESFDDSGASFDCSSFVQYVLYKRGCLRKAKYAPLKAYIESRGRRGERLTSSNFPSYFSPISPCKPGHLLRRNGHVGFYAGDGKAYSAIGKSKGIGYQNSFGTCYKSPCSLFF